MILAFLALARAQVPPGTEPPAPSTEPAAAPSADDVERAKLIYNNGAALYAEGQYEAAIQAFEEAYRLSKNPKLLMNLANAQERIADLEGAFASLTTYRIYAAATEVETLERRLRALEVRIDEAKEKERLAAVPAPVAPAPAPVPAPPPAPVQPTFVEVSNPARWATVIGGGVVAVGFGAVAGATYASGRGFVETGDRDRYDAIRPLNAASLSLAVVGAGVGALGFALPATRRVPAASVSASPAGVTVAGSF